MLMTTKEHDRSVRMLRRLLMCAKSCCQILAKYSIFTRCFCLEFAPINTTLRKLSVTSMKGLYMSTWEIIPSSSLICLVNTHV